MKLFCYHFPLALQYHAFSLLLRFLRPDEKHAPAVSFLSLPLSEAVSILRIHLTHRPAAVLCEAIGRNKHETLMSVAPSLFERDIKPMAPQLLSFHSYAPLPFSSSLLPTSCWELAQEKQEHLCCLHKI